MSVFLQRCLVFASLLFLTVPAFSQTPGDVRSAGSGNWTNMQPASIWEQYRLAYGGWKVRSQKEVGADSVAMRSPGYNAGSWLKAQVPGTIFGAYVKAGIEPDPSYGDNIYKMDYEKYRANHWYRTEFTIPGKYAGKLVWLNFNGVNKTGEIYINNKKLGGVKGFMIRGRYNITDKINPNGTNVLAVLVRRMSDSLNNWESPTYKPSAGWDWMPSVPGVNRGITNKVYLSASGPVTLADPWMRTMELQGQNTSAKMRFNTQLKNHTNTAQTGVLTAIINPGNIRLSQTIKFNPNELKTYSPADFVMSNPKLWWPNGYGDPHLYTCKLVFEINGAVSDSTSFKFGVRKYGYRNDNNGVLQLSINGKRVYCKGGNWGIPDFMLGDLGREYETRIRFHVDMNMNMIRNWTGSTTDEAFYDMCDKYGIMVWDDFWLNNAFTFLFDEKAFLANVPEKLKRFRNHASIAVWCGSNENVPFQDRQLQDSTLKYDGGDRLYQSSSNSKNISSKDQKIQFGMPNQGGLSGSGPWDTKDIRSYFTGSGVSGHSEPRFVGKFGFRSEIGATAFPNVESFKKFIPADKLWPRNEMWDRAHYFSNDWAYGGGAGPSDYMNRINRFYGTATGIDDFCKKAQLLNYETHRAMFEGWQDNIWKDASGILMWMSQSAFPTMIWQTYDYYYDCTGAYYGVKKANEPVHIQWSIADEGVKVVNNTHTTLTNLTAKSTVYDIAGNIVPGYSKSVVINALKDTITYAMKAGNIAGLNFALNKPAFSSNEESNHRKADAFDGNSSTRWAAGETSNNSWIYVDLGALTKIQAVQLVWESFASSYKIQVSNNATNWTDVYSTTTGDGGTDAITFNEVTARYVRMQCVQRNGFFGVSLFEFGVYSKLPAVDFLKLELTDNTGKLVSENLYWRSGGDYTTLNNIPQVKLSVTSSTERVGDKQLMKVKIANPANSGGVAFGLHVQLTNPSTKERVLPVLISDNYFTVFKGEEKNITIEYDPALLGGSEPELKIDQYSDKPFAEVDRDTVSAISPDTKTGFNLFVKDGRMYYQLNRNNKSVIEPSLLSLTVNDKMPSGIKSFTVAERKTINQTYAVMGGHSEAVNNCEQILVKVNEPLNLGMMLEIKVFNDGAAFRYILPGNFTKTVTADDTEFTIPAGNIVWSQADVSNYEGVYIKKAIESVKKGDRVGPPLTFILPDNGGYGVILEGGNDNFAGMSLTFNGNRQYKGRLQGKTIINGELKTPWHIVQISADLNALVNSDIVGNVSPAPDPELFPQGVNTRWLKPGKSTWSWLATTGTPLFEVTYKNMLRYSKLAGQMGIEYNLVDHGWEYYWATGNKTKWDVLKELVDSSRAHNVKIWVWRSYNNLDFFGDPGLKDSTARREFFAKCREVGVAGLKLDFFTGETQEVQSWMQAALKDAAREKLMINFHGAPKPSGHSTTWPNEMTREAIRGLEHGNPGSKWPEHNTALPFTRFLAGAGDYTPLSLRTQIVPGTTLTHQLATVIAFTSPFMCLGVNPDSLAVSPVRHMIKGLPTTWDETRILPQSEIGGLAIMARRKGTTWYLAAINGPVAKSVNISLSFLGNGNYKSLLYRDDDNANAKTIIVNTDFTGSGVLTGTLKAGGGIAARFEKQ
ncbi:hypothetical protein DJ568_14495 [Mucilaginibacter hurinus]|uniref:F5/8 type C domain-containing protein n=1 Tax=Mucilaginibacter hurinus TaxID=2201324 RepID=A0A367GKV3_9SPHI|nr:glycoside hydrolase family 97 catalytic domain-containing protein [Mucilaginibacter hurinus]RCH54089.1 hypothetical protein DJ568_14495 [Mucilaginibacter hurinus]